MTATAGNAAATPTTVKPKRKQATSVPAVSDKLARNSTRYGPLLPETAAELPPSLAAPRRLSISRIPFGDGFDRGFRIRVPLLLFR